MRLVVLAIGLAAVAVPAAAQPNPFKLPKSNLKGGAEVTYTLSGDITGSAMMPSSSHDRCKLLAIQVRMPSLARINFQA